MPLARPEQLPVTRKRKSADPHGRPGISPGPLPPVVLPQRPVLLGVSVTLLILWMGFLAWVAFTG